MKTGILAIHVIRKIICVRSLHARAALKRRKTINIFGFRVAGAASRWHAALAYVVFYGATTRGYRAGNFCEIRA